MTILRLLRNWSPCFTVSDMRKRVLLGFFTEALLLAALFVFSVNSGSIKVSYSELLQALFGNVSENAAIVFDLRLPRILIAVLTGASLAVSGALFQSALKNPLADPGILGISSAAEFASVLIVSFAPRLFFLSPVFAFIGGLAACALVYVLSWKNGFSPLRIILVGVAVNAVFSGLTGAFTTMSGQNYTGAASVVNANISLKTWDDVRLLAIYTVVGLVLACAMARGCDLMALEDKTVRALGVNVSLLRVIVSFSAVLLASITTAVAGTISFVGLISPHIGRLLVGSSHKRLIPFSMLLGAIMTLAADTAGRLIAYPYEVSPAIIMSVIGGPFFIILLKGSGKTYGS